MEEKDLFDKYDPGKHWKKHPTAYAERFAEFLKKRKFQGLLVDVGCGNGRDMNVFRESGLSAVGIDNLDDNLKTAKSNFPECNFEKQDVENLKFKDDSVSAFYMINIIHYVKKEVALKEIYRVLKKNGFLFIHFNILIQEVNGKVDYKHEEKDIMELISDFKIIQKRIFEREDLEPVKHTHRILELILQKTHK